MTALVVASVQAAQTSPVHANYLHNVCVCALTIHVVGCCLQFPASLQGTASTKTRSEVRGGGKKPYQQKGTGRARQGSRRTPLRPGGGVVFGPKPKDWSINMNKKEKRLAMATALQSAAEDTVAVESFAPLQDKLKTKTLCDICMKVGVNVMNKHTLLVTRGVNADVNRCGRNIGKLTINPDTTINAYNILRADKIIIEKPALDLLIRRFSGDRDDAVAANKESWASEAERKKAEAEEEEKHQGKKSALKTKAKKNTLKELKPKYTKNGQRGRKGSRRLPRGAKAPAKAAASTPAAAESAAAS